MSEKNLYGFQPSTVATPQNSEKHLSSMSLPLLIATWTKADLSVAATHIQPLFPATGIPVSSKLALFDLLIFFLTLSWSRPSLSATFWRACPIVAGERRRPYMNSST